LKTQEPNYHAFFGIGIIFIAVGIVLSASINNYGMGGIAVLGIIFMTVGLNNRDKWSGNKKKNKENN
jgi:hypothetical protein